MEVIGSKRCPAFRALPQPRVIAAADALRTEDMEALCEDCVLLPGAAARAVELGLQQMRGVIVVVGMLAHPSLCRS